MSLIKAEGLSKSYGTSKNTVVNAVASANLEIRRGELAALVGPSGSGKSTLLGMLGLIIKPDSGAIFMDGKRIDGMRDGPCCRFRNANLGYIMQDFALIDDESVYSNIRLPLLYNRRIARSEHRRRILAAAESLGIADKLRRRASQLSGGERQRVAIARAIVCDQPVILADEPTGSLDAENRDRVMDVLVGLSRERGRTVILVTHDLSVAERCDRTIRMKDGKLIAETENLRDQ